MRRRGLEVPATAARTETSAALRRLLNALDVLGPSIRVVFGVRSGLRNPRRLTVLAITNEAPLAVFYALRVPGPSPRQRRTWSTTTSGTSSREQNRAIFVFVARILGRIRPTTPDLRETAAVRRPESYQRY